MSIRLSAFSAAATALALLCMLQAWALWRAPALWYPAAITLTLRPGEAIVLGQQELAAPQADQRHLALRRDASGHWLAHNVSAARQLVIERKDVEQRMGSSALHMGQQFQLGATRFTVDAASATKVALSAGQEHWEYDGASLLRNGLPQAPCPETRLGARALAAWNRMAPAALSLARPLTFGGNLYCDNRLGVANATAGSATLARVRGRLLLASGSPDGERAPLMLGASELAQSEERLDDATGLVVGRTRLALSSEGDTMTLRPTRHVALFADPGAHPEHVTWHMQQRRLWSLPASTAWLAAPVLCCLLMLGAGLAWQRGDWPFARAVGAPVRGAALGSALLAVAGIGALLMQRSGAPPGVAVSMLLGWAALWCCLLMAGRPTLASTAATLLLALGLLAQLELGLGAMESSWLRYFQKTVALLALGIGAGTHVRLRLEGGASVIPQTRLEWVLAALAACALGALLLQVLFGDETGVFDLQPVEFAKLALTALTAHCLALGMGWDAGTPDQANWRIRWFRLGAPALVFLALLGLALVQVDDYSPLILLVVWSMAMAMAYALAARRHALGAGMAVLACLGIGAVVLLRGAGAADVAQWSFYGDRFLVWLDPLQHPHTGQQMLLGASAIAEGAWWGADHWLGIPTLGQAGGSALHIPAVQDDFAPSFFLNRHGLMAGMALWALQALFLVGLLQTAAHAFIASRQARHFRQAWQGRFRCFVLCGGAAFVLGHLLLSWGTNLAIFPIMGQPMSFLSAGGSHLLFFICPLLAFSAISAQSIEENQSCRSMSNTKY